MSLADITRAATDPQLLDRMTSAAAQAGVDAPDHMVSTNARRIVSHKVGSETIAQVYASAQAYLEAHRAGKEAEINTSGQPPLTVVLGTSVGAYHAAVSDTLITAAVTAVLNPAG